MRSSRLILPSAPSGVDRPVAVGVSVGAGSLVTDVLVGVGVGSSVAETLVELGVGVSVGVAVGGMFVGVGVFVGAVVAVGVGVYSVGGVDRPCPLYPQHTAAPSARSPQV